MDFGGLLFFGPALGPVQLLGRRKRRRHGGARGAGRRCRARVRHPGAIRRSARAAGSRCCCGSWSGRSDQRRGRAGPDRTPGDVPLPAAEEVEERESLEVDPEVVSLEQRRRPARATPTVSQDENAERARGAPHRRGGGSERHAHQGRPCGVRHAHPRRSRPMSPRSASHARRAPSAIVWREMLGPPVSLRDEGS